jgi:tetratricopeptide (TPR) repeat protein/NAD-dependent dihydropyrimidine dehydrogenase PreA subunit
MAESSKSCSALSDRESAPPLSYDPDPVTRGQVRRSRMGKRRAWVLVAIHVLVFIRILTWKLGDGEVVGPVEPSEAMYALADGVFNAGAVMLMVSMLSVLILGRFFCGWACHLVALQDGAAWLLHKMGIRPRPLRSRWLVFIPLGAGLFMFGMPLLNRLSGFDRSGETRGFFTDDLWETFPGFWVGLLTFLVCGFGMVYLLGAKGFCTYACPYGGLFGVADRFSPLRIRVNDACKACGHCTAVCTSNVEVAFEVHRYGAVVDPGCMKCLDCVSSCPEGALSLGFGKPAVLTGTRRSGGKDRRRFPSFGAEFFVFAVFALSLLLFVGLPRRLGDWDLSWASNLHGVMPLLFGLGISATNGFLALGVYQALRGRESFFQRWTLRREGKLTSSGRIFLTLAAIYGLFMVALGSFQYSMWKGDYHYGRLDVAQLAGRPEGSTILPEAAADLAAATAAFERAESLRIFPDLRPAARLGGLAAAERDFDRAEDWMQQALSIDPDYAPSWAELAEVRRMRGDAAGERRALEKALELAPRDVDLLWASSRLEQRAQDPEAFLAANRRLLAALPEDDTSRRALILAEIGTVEIRRGQREAGLKALREAVREAPESFIAQANLASALAEVSETEEALKAYRAGVALRPFDFAFRGAYRAFLKARGRDAELRADIDAGLEALEKARAVAPEDANLALTTAAEYFAQRRFEPAAAILKQLQARFPDDPRVQNLVNQLRQAQGR